MTSVVVYHVVENQSHDLHNGLPARVMTKYLHSIIVRRATFATMKKFHVYDCLWPARIQL